MSDREFLFEELSVEEMSCLLENIEADNSPEFSSEIKLSVFKEIAPEAVTENKKSGFSRIFKIIPMAAALVIVIMGAVVAVNNLVTDKPEETTTAVVTTQITTTENTSFNPLKSAISLGDEKLIETLVANTLLLSKDIIAFAVECADVLSYTAIQTIAEATRETFGTTGLDALLEKAILGDSQGVLEELREREKILMTPAEKLAFFFSAAFCDSEVISEFLEKGFDLSLKDAAGKSVYEIAEKYGNEENVILADKSNSD